ncbi:unnamed protein product, partial [marine sediment metagenome]
WLKPEGDCLVWTRYRLEDGYGYIKYKGTMITSNRLFWMLRHSRDIPKGMVIRHTCDNPPCCKDEHLVIGTQGDNIIDDFERGRVHGKSKVTECPQGHPYDAKNTQIDYIGHRQCRICKRVQSRRSEVKRRAKKKEKERIEKDKSLVAEIYASLDRIEVALSERTNTPLAKSINV